MCCRCPKRGAGEGEHRKARHIDFATEVRAELRGREAVEWVVGVVQLPIVLYEAGLADPVIKVPGFIDTSGERWSAGREQLVKATATDLGNGSIQSQLGRLIMGPELIPCHRQHESERESINQIGCSAE